MIDAGTAAGGPTATVPGHYEIVLASVIREYGLRRVKEAMDAHHSPCNRSFANSTVTDIVVPDMPYGFVCLHGHVYAADCPDEEQR